MLLFKVNAISYCDKVEKGIYNGITLRSWGLLRKEPFSMRKHLSPRDRIIIQYQIEHYHDVSLKSLTLDLKCSESSMYREFKRNISSQVLNKASLCIRKLSPARNLRRYPMSALSVCTYHDAPKKSLWTMPMKPIKW